MKKPQQRRAFLRQLMAGVSATTLSACGGSDAADSLEMPSAGAAPTPANPAATGTPSAPPPTGSLAPSTPVPPSAPGAPPPASPTPPAPAPTPPAPTPAPAPAPSGSMAFTLVSPNGGSSVPYTLGYAFRKGDVPASRTLAVSTGTAQVVAKNRWPDGSLKFALISGRAPLSANAPLTLTLVSGPPASGSVLSTADLRTSGLTASVGCGSFGTASWAAADWDAPHQAWLSGPEMSSWIYRKPVGSDAHLVAWLEVRLWAGGAVEVVPWVENGYLRVAGPTNKVATYTFTLAGSQRFSAAIDLPNRCRTPLLSGSITSHWLGNNPNVTVKHDTDYLQSTRLVPTYRANVTPSAKAVTSLPSQFTPLQQGSLPNGMGAAGYHPSIGMLPEWDVLYLRSTAAAPYAALQYNAYSAGRYGIHLRDEATQRPIRFSQHPNLVLGGGLGISGSGASSTNSYTTTGTGTAPAAWASSHHPSVGFLAYLVTGRFYFLEELQFVATTHFLKNSDATRGFTQGVLRSNAGANTTRGAAWAWRSLAMAACLSPDDDVLAGEFAASLQSNINYYHARYVAQPNNPFGFVTPYSDYTGVGDNVYFEATWMQDFFTAAMGMTKSMELNLTSTAKNQLDALFAWKARSVVGRLGAPSEFLYRDAAPYTIAVAPTDTPNFENGSGPWHASWSDLYRDTYASANPGPREDGPLRGGYYPNPTSYWGNMQPALAYAVDHGVPGASEAYRRLTTAPNWADIVTAFDVDAVWSVKPSVML
jgi:hypothetical protein